MRFFTSHGTIYSLLGLLLLCAGCVKRDQAANESTTETAPVAVAENVAEAEPVITNMPANRAERELAAAPVTVPAAPLAFGGRAGGMGAARGSLAVGDPAPPISIAEWATGEPVSVLANDQVYVVEFWATWCPPCRSSMPHISQLQQDYGDSVTFIGVTQEDRETVDGFLEQEQSPGKTWRQAVQYRLALDDAGATNAAYMQAAGQGGIPTAFIVGRAGRVEWIGHPMQMEGPLAQVVAGDWDRDAAIAERQLQPVINALAAEVKRLSAAQNWTLAETLIAHGEEQHGKLPAFAQLRVVLQTAKAAAAPVIPLGIGDSAPPIAIADWATGEPVSALVNEQVYVVEFWATWCPPCRTSMPHLSQLQQEYGDQVTFIGVTREDRKTVDGFLEQEQSEGKTWRDVVQYRLALDDQDVTNNAYMKAAGQSGIPTAFIVGRSGQVEWIGHPMQMDQPLAKIVSGEWDREVAIAEFKQAQALKTVARELGALARAEKWDAALDLLDQAAAEHGTSSALTQYRMYILKNAGRTEEATALEAEIVEQAWENATALNEIAWGIATDGRKHPDLALALKAATRACELQDHKDASTLDTLARIYFEQGQLVEAIKWQQQAVALNQGANSQIDETLKAYQAAAAKLEAATTEIPTTETPPAVPVSETAPGN